LRSFRSVQPVDLVLLASDPKGRPAAEAVRRHLLSLLAGTARTYLVIYQYLDIKLLGEGFG
jgi:hypothetical protein